MRERHPNAVDSIDNFVNESCGGEKISGGGFTVPWIHSGALRYRQTVSSDV
jgi:hypothetical protein